MKSTFVRLVFASALALTGCGDDSSPDPDSGTPDADHTVDAGDAGRDAGEEPGTESYLSDWVWLRESTPGGSAERDKSINSISTHGDGNSLRLRGMVFEKGIGVAASSEIRINLDKRCSRFRATVGIDDEVIVSGTARAEVWLDGMRVFESGMMTRETEAEEVEADVREGTELRLVVLDFEDPMNNHVDWADARVICNDEDWRGDAVTSYVSDWAWESSSNEDGPVERDQNNGAAAEDDGRSIRLDSRQFSKGIGTHAPSEVEIDLAGHCRRFLATVGIDDETTSGGSAVFQVFADDEKLFDSDTLTATSDSENVDVDLVGRSNLRLVVADGGDGNESDLADWADARLLCRTGWEGEPVDTYVSDWVFNLGYNSYGPIERDMTNGGPIDHDGTPISIDGDEYARGIGMHAFGEVELNLDNRCTRFQADVGIDDDASGGGSIASVVFRVFGGESPLFETGVVHHGEEPMSIDVDVTGVTKLTMVSDNHADDAAWDHADWGNARLTCDVGAQGL